MAAPSASSPRSYREVSASDASALALLVQLLAKGIASALEQKRAQERPLPRLALSPEEAARALGVSRDFFDQHLIPELRVVRRGRRRLIPVRELERWLDEEAARALEGGRTWSR
jgi:excisionase family DNA binding protein